MRGAASGGFESHTHFECPVRSQEYRARLLLLPPIQTCRGSLSDMTPKGTLFSAEDIHGRIDHGTAHALDEAAQALEDVMGRERFSAVLNRNLSVNEVKPQMQSRKTRPPPGERP